MKTPGATSGIYLAKYACQLTHVEIAKHFTHLSASGVGASIRRCKQLLPEDQHFKMKMDKITTLLR